jgi:hypothetical protein
MVMRTSWILMLASLMVMATAAAEGEGQSSADQETEGESSAQASPDCVIVVVVCLPELVCHKQTDDYGALPIWPSGTHLQAGGLSTQDPGPGNLGRSFGPYDEYWISEDLDCPSGQSIYDI